jgi:hypothetical protein
MIPITDHAFDGKGSSTGICQVMVITHDERMVFVSGHTCGRPESVHSRIDLLETTLLPFLHWLRTEYVHGNSEYVRRFDTVDADEDIIEEYKSK